MLAEDGYKVLLHFHDIDEYELISAMNYLASAFGFDYAISPPISKVEIYLVLIGKKLLEVSYLGEAIRERAAARHLF